MYIIIHFIDRNVYVEKWDTKCLEKYKIENAATNLIPTLNKIRVNDIESARILCGPGSFTSIKIILVVGEALKFASIKVIGITLDEAIRVIDGYQKCMIILRLNTTIYYVYTNQWNICKKTELPSSTFTTPHNDELNIDGSYIPWPDIGYGMSQCKNINYKTLQPLYLFL